MPCSTSRTVVFNVQAAPTKDHSRAASAALGDLVIGQPVLLLREPWASGDEGAVAVQTLSGELVGRLVSDGSGDKLQV